MHYLLSNRHLTHLYASLAIFYGFDDEAQIDLESQLTFKLISGRIDISIIDDHTMCGIYLVFIDVFH